MASPDDVFTPPDTDTRAPTLGLGVVAGLGLIRRAPGMLLVLAALDWAGTKLPIEIATALVDAGIGGETLPPLLPAVELGGAMVFGVPTLALLVAALVELRRGDSPTTASVLAAAMRPACLAVCGLWLVAVTLGLSLCILPGILLGAAFAFTPVVAAGGGGLGESFTRGTSLVSNGGAFGRLLILHTLCIGGLLGAGMLGELPDVVAMVQAAVELGIDPTDPAALEGHHAPRWVSLAGQLLLAPVVGGIYLVQLAATVVLAFEAAGQDDLLLTA